MMFCWGVHVSFGEEGFQYNPCMIPLLPSSPQDTEYCNNAKLVTTRILEIFLLYDMSLELREVAWLGSIGTSITIYMMVVDSRFT